MREGRRRRANPCLFPFRTSGPFPVPSLIARDGWRACRVLVWSLPVPPVQRPREQPRPPAPAVAWEEPRAGVEVEDAPLHAAEGRAADEVARWRRGDGHRKRIKV